MGKRIQNFTPRHSMTLTHKGQLYRYIGALFMIFVVDVLCLICVTERAYDFEGYSMKQLITSSFYKAIYVQKNDAMGFYTLLKLW